MASFDLVNYSLRQNKAIQRSLVFEAVGMLQETMDLENLLYLGLGSLWFTDFQIAHKSLGIRDMISMEGDEIGYRRARFNQPFKTVKVKRGYSYKLLPRLIETKALNGRPWFAWLDYDKALDEAKVGDVRRAIESAPENSVFVVTLPATGRPFGRPIERPDRLRKLLGGVVPDDLAIDDCRDERLPLTLSKLVSDFMSSSAARVARPGGFVPAFSIRYKDSTPMITVGGILPAKGAAPAAWATVRAADWPALCKREIVAPPLTLKEAAVFQSQLPALSPMTRTTIRRLGFDLKPDQLKSFERYYRYYPVFAQVSP